MEISYPAYCPASYAHDHAKLHTARYIYVLMADLAGALRAFGSAEPLIGTHSTAETT
jgi:hypothetical protein